MADNMVGFSMADIPVFVFQLFYAGLLAFLLVKLVRGKKDDRNIAAYVTLGIALALTTAVVKHSVALGLVALAGLSLLRLAKFKETFDNTLLLILIIVTGVGSGAGMAFPTTIGLVVIVLIQYLLPSGSENE